MRVVVTGSIATDHLMTFPSSIARQILPGSIDQISLSFLVDELEVRRGGVAANIALGMRRLGAAATLVAAAGRDFDEYAAWLEDNGVSTTHVRRSPHRHTARFLCTSDEYGNQIASFYPGAMTEARDITLAPVVAAVGGADLVLVGANDPEAMRRHTDECRRTGLRFAADPSQQIARLSGAELRHLVTGADHLFVNAYELALLSDKTGWTETALLDRLGTLVVTHGASGVRIVRAGAGVLRVPAVSEVDVVDATGGGDAFRAGYLAGLGHRLSPERAAQLGCAVASVVLETVGTQDYHIEPRDLLARLGYTYGRRCADETAPLLTSIAAVHSP